MADGCNSMVGIGVGDGVGSAEGGPVMVGGDVGTEVGDMLGPGVGAFVGGALKSSATLAISSNLVSNDTSIFEHATIPFSMGSHDVPAT